MTYKGRIKNGVVVLDDPSALPEGTEVSVRAVDGRPKSGPEPGTHPPQTLHDRLKPFIGIVKDLPHDLAENHDHYLYGVPKQE